MCPTKAFHTPHSFTHGTHQMGSIVNIASLTRSYRVIGWAAIASGAIGIIAYGCLMLALAKRNAVENTDALSLFFFSAHGLTVVVQLLLMIPLVIELKALSRQSTPTKQSSTFNGGVVAISLTTLLLLLIYVNFVSDGLYMLPQGAFGVWLMLVNWNLREMLPAWLRYFGMVTGVGLLLVGISFGAYAIVVDTVVLRIPAAPLSDYPHTFSAVNAFLHQVLYVGTCMGVATLPIWTALTGWRLLAEID
jgi:hypothetical protein